MIVLSPNVRTVLILGDGTLAHALQNRFSHGRAKVVRAGKKPGPWHLDLARDPSFWRVPPNPAWVFVCAGITSRQRCENHPHASRQVNVTGGIRLARHFCRPGTRIVFFGTDLGPEGGEYARQKEDLRAAVAGLAGIFWVRLGKVVYPGLPVLLGWREQASGGVVEAWEDVKIRPISPAAVAEACAALMESKEFLPKQMDWGVTTPISYRDLALRWIQATKGLGHVKVLGVKAPCREKERLSGVCPQALRAVLEREEKKEWWSP